MPQKCLFGFILHKSKPQFKRNHNVAHNDLTYQLLLIYCWLQFRRLKSAIKASKLTKALEILESLGFSGELALFFVANIQNNLEVA
jgi:hypothetical protein